MIRQGDIYWADLGPPRGAAPALHRPVVVVQSDAFNASGIRTTLVCILTTNLDLAKAPGNVLLDRGEGGLRQPSVVNVTQVVMIDKDDLTDKIGAVSSGIVAEILEGVFLIMDPLLTDE